MNHKLLTLRAARRGPKEEANQNGSFCLLVFAYWLVNIGPRCCLSTLIALCGVLWVGGDKVLRCLGIASRAFVGALMWSLVNLA